MEQQNPYQSPQAVVSDVAMGPELAGRGARLGAAILDGLIALVVVGPIMFFGGYFASAMSGEQIGMGTQLAWGVLGIALFFAIQYLPLKQSGQTWGKKIVGVRIVDLDGAQPGIGVLLGRRYLFSNGISLVPFLGGLLSLVNVLFIFRADKRCLHDLVAGTQVVRK